ncbi:MAG TPA: phosphoenolpyruvate--protein phosphotransferase [Verrucomicrobiae bacterium]|jgi:phosphotransferase system enzyme I (PtsI)|nr:phosphoenolpyruvate--protein phosphotransferase [Verrucomicrobiae bacterium]
MTDQGQTGERVYKGIPVSAGICQGKIFVLHKAQAEIPKYEVADEDLPLQVQRFEQALALTRQQLLEVQHKVSEALNAQEASIFDAHLLVLEDPTLIESVNSAIFTKKINVEAAFHEFAQKYTATLSAIDDAYLRERAADMRDVTLRIMNNLLGHGTHPDLQNLREPCIVVSDDLAPSEVAILNRKVVLGFATDVGSRTSHTAIMARSLRVPAIVGLKGVSKRLQTGAHALLDGYNGSLIVNPTDQSLFEYGQLVRRHASIEEKLHAIKDLEAITLDGKKIMLAANVEKPGDVEAVRNFGCEGVGLFRTEYLFINRDTLPTEEEQYVAYRQVASELKPSPVIIRTLDLGGDKFLSHLPIPMEMNPFLGWRAIRFCLEEREVFRSQLRAILRASAEGNVQIMYPMISSYLEVEKANAFVEEYKNELRAEGVPFDENIEIGAMVEIPSAAIAADVLGKRVKFFSIGTNDLIQYSLAVDRLNERIAQLYEPTHPAVLRLIKWTADAAVRNNIWCGVCGEMAGDPLLTPLLLGLGVTELSMAPPLLPQVKYLIRRLKMDDAKALADFALNCESAREIFERSEALAKRIAPSLFENQSELL